MTETRTHDLHTYKVLSPDWLTQHEPRTLEHMLTTRTRSYELADIEFELVEEGD